MKITVIYDNNASQGMKADHGFSALVEYGGERILFDTGAKLDILRQNARALGISLDVDILILSHYHWDHIGGRAAVSAREVVIPSSFPPGITQELSSLGDVISVSDPMEIRPGMWTTGPMGTRIPEQALYFKSDRGYVVLTGCCHPGLENVVSFVGSKGHIHAVMGGFHGFDQYDALKDVDVIIPCHCTAHTVEIRGAWGKKVVDCSAGSVYKF